MQYREFPAPAQLSHAVRCVWTFEGGFARAHDECICPDGSPELIFHFGAPYEEVAAGGTWRAQPRALFAGNLTQPLMLRAKGPVGVLGIRLWPHAVAQFVAQAPRDTLDARLALGREATRWATGVVAKLLADSSEAAVLGAATSLVDKLSRPGAQHDAAVAWAVAELFASQGQAPLDGLAQSVQLSRRQFERRMAGATGMTPKLLASIIRFRAVFDQINAQQPTAWLNAALATGFFDQAHMIRAFRRFAGSPPRAYLEKAGILSAALVAPR